MNKQDEHIINDLTKSLRQSNKNLRVHRVINGVLFFIVISLGLVGWSLFL